MKGEQYLTKSLQYGVVYKHGNSWANRIIVMRAMPNGLDLSRYGLSVSRRVGKAVARNRVKRRLREVMRKTVLNPGWDIVLIARPPAAGTGYRVISGSVRDLLLRAGLSAGNYEEYCPGVN